MRFFQHIVAASFIGMLAGCSPESSDKCEIRVHDVDEGALVRMYCFNANGQMELKDSIRVVNSIASFRDDVAQGQSELRILVYGKKNIIFVVEHGVVDVKNGMATGTKLNDAKCRYDVRADSLRRIAEIHYDSIATDASLSPDDRRASLSELLARTQKQSLAMVHDVLRENATNALGQYVFWRDVANNPLTDVDAFLREAANVDQSVLRFGPVARTARRFARQDVTRAGTVFADVEAQDAHQEAFPSVRLSEVVHAEGKRVLVHIFDPRNEQTPRDLAVLFQIRKRYPNVDIVSFCELPDENIARRIAVKFRPDWHFWSDKTNSASEVYGVSTLPFFMVLADSIILSRGVSLDAVEQWVAPES